MYMLIWVGQSYIADTGLLVAHYFMDDKFTDNELYRDIYIWRGRLNGKLKIKETDIGSCR